MIKEKLQKNSGKKKAKIQTDISLDLMINVTSAEDRGTTLESVLRKAMAKARTLGEVREKAEKGKAPIVEKEKRKERDFLKDPVHMQVLRHS